MAASNAWIDSYLEALVSWFVCLRRAALASEEHARKRPICGATAKQLRPSKARLSSPHAAIAERRRLPRPPNQQLSSGLSSEFTRKANDASHDEADEDSNIAAKYYVQQIMSMDEQAIQSGWAKVCVCVCLCVCERASAEGGAPQWRAFFVWRRLLLESTTRAAAALPRDVVSPDPLAAQCTTRASLAARQQTTKHTRRRRNGNRRRRPDHLNKTHTQKTHLRCATSLASPATRTRGSSTCRGACGA
jgi:hypothetical protein